MNGCSFQQEKVRKTWGGSCLNTQKRYLLKVLFWSQHKKHRFFWKTVLGIFKTALCLRDRYAFMWQSVKILNFFNTLTLKQIFKKMKKFFKKLENRFIVVSTKIENAYFHTKLSCQKSILRQMPWWVQKGPITKNEVLLVTTLNF